VGLRRSVAGQVLAVGAKVPQIGVAGIITLQARTPGSWARGALLLLVSGSTPAAIVGLTNWNLAPPLRIARLIATGHLDQGLAGQALELLSAHEF